MIKIDAKSLIKTGGVAALLASSLTVCDSAFAINLTISNTSFTGGDGNGGDAGQSFINDSGGSGATVYLNSWTFALPSAADANNANALTLRIYSGIGNAGSLVGSSIGSTTTTFAGQPGVQWNFNSLPLTDNLTYTAVMSGSSSGNPFFLYTTSNPYPNGGLVQGTDDYAGSGYDMVFQGQFSAAPIPFGFEPTGGLAVLGGAWLLHKRLQKKATQKQEQ
jgi:hypothetical protein